MSELCAFFSLLSEAMRDLVTRGMFGRDIFFVFKRNMRVKGRLSSNCVQVLTIIMSLCLENVDANSEVNYIEVYFDLH